VKAGFQMHTYNGYLNYLQRKKCSQRRESKAGYFAKLKGVIMRPKSEQEIWNENVANMQLKLAPKKDFEKLLNESYDPIANAMRRHPKLTKETAEAMAKAFGF
jgi:hypothetical protein